MGMGGGEFNRAKKKILVRRGELPFPSGGAETTRP